MSTNLPQEQESNEKEAEKEMIILDCEPETRFESEQDDQKDVTAESQEEQGYEQPVVSGTETPDLFEQQEKTDEDSNQSKEKGTIIPEMREERFNEIKQLIVEQAQLLVAEQQKVANKTEENADKLNQLLAEEKSIELNFDLEGLEKEFKKMNRKISSMRWLCLLSLATSLALGSIAAYFGLGYFDVLTLKEGEDVELHAIVHGEEGDRYSLLGTMSVGENGEVNIEEQEIAILGKTDHFELEFINLNTLESTKIKNAETVNLVTALSIKNN